jgi:outer membrane protein insertion porin family
LQTKPAEICGDYQGPRRQVLVGGVVYRSPRRQAARSAEIDRPDCRLRSAGLSARRSRFSLLFFALILLCASTGTISIWSQEPPSTPAAPVTTTANPPAFSVPDAANNSVLALDGLTVQHISFEGVPADRLTPLPGHLDQAEGAPLSADNLKKTLRQLYATGLYDSIQVQASREAQASRQAAGVALTFVGTPRTFIGTVSVDGAIGPTMNTQLERASQLQAGTRFTQAKMLRAVQQMRSTLEDNGYHEARITQTITPHAEQQLADVAFRVVSGPRARVGKIVVTGDSGMNLEEFRRHANLRPGAHVDHDIVNRALDGVLREYQKQNRLEADVKLESAKYNSATKAVDYSFTANRGPVVKVEVKGAAVGADRVKHLVPIFEEGSVDEDLLNEGNRRLRDFFQRQGYFDVKVDHQSQAPASNQPVSGQPVSGQPASKLPSNDRVDILYTIQLGPRRRVEKVSVDGNHYFDSATLTNLLSVHTAGVIDRHGVYSQALVSADVSAIQGVYQSNGFAHVKVTPETSTPETVIADNPSPAGPQTPIDHSAPLQVIYHIVEGPQLRVGTLGIDGNSHIATTTLTALMNTALGQPLSPLSLAGDHDAIVTDYYSRGFDQATVTIAQQTETSDSSKVDVVFHVDEGEQLFVRDVSLTGLVFTRPQTVARAITLHAGDPLNRTALSDTQRNLYDFALFNEVNVAVENPDGGAPQKTILLQTVEARRWTLTPGIGFEAQTGQPQNNCAGATAGGVKCNPNGKTGVSPRVLADITRNGLFGRDQSVSLRGTYGLLEQSAGIQYQIPHLQGNPNFGFTFSGGYANSLDVSTYVASRLEAAFRFTQNFNRPGSWLSRANTFVYEIDFRRVKVSASSLQVYPGEISLLSTATRVGGPAFTWIRDTRDLAMDARRGTYTSFQEFLSDRFFGAEAEFNRIDTSNSSYYSFDKGRYVVARNTRYGQIRAFGSGANGIIPLPERLYAGGAVSLRGFSQNAAGPRDPETGFQIGGAGALTNSTELRLPPPTLPWLSNTVSFVIFHDMGNVFTNAGDAWASALRVRQPDSAACRTLTYGSSTNPPEPNGPYTSTGRQGQCSFNDFSHSLGLGLRYHTPVGPIRFDVSYNLNPPIYPVNINYSTPISATTPLGPYQAPYVGQSPHINFFFSLGQAF